MKILTLTLIVAAAALQAGGALAAESAPQARPMPVRNVLVCRWEATQQSGIPIQLCLTRKQWAARTAYTQQWIREYQARSFVTK
jgi:hypothetical protein